VSQRIDISKAAPSGFQALWALERYVAGAVDRTVLDLVKLRASILNECTYCIDMHSRDAATAGETQQRLFAVAAWREAPFFDERERAARALTDALTRLTGDGGSDLLWKGVSAVWSEQETANLVLAVATINAWNRVTIATRLQPTAA
jgi:AhpD family alkylhydroperoxidase